MHLQAADAIMRARASGLKSKERLAPLRRSAANRRRSSSSRPAQLLAEQSCRRTGRPDRFPVLEQVAGPRPAEASPTTTATPAAIA